MKNQLTSAIISLVLAATMTTPMYVFADEESVRTYEGEGYEVTYKVTGSWVGNQNVEVTLANTGSVEGTEVVQLYVRDLVGSITRPVKELKHFQRVSLKSGESRKLEVEIPVSDLAFVGLDGVKKVEPGEFRLWVAGDSASGEPVSFNVQ